MTLSDSSAPTQTVRYTLKGAAFLLRVPPSTLQTWANGYTLKLAYGRISEKRGILLSDRTEPHLFNFWELIELMLVRELVRKRKDALGNPAEPYATLDQVRDMVQNMKPGLGDSPLARGDLQRVLGQIVSPNIKPGFLTNVALGQHLLEYADELVSDLEFDTSENGFVSVWYPQPNHVIRVNPNMRWGMPSVPSGVTAEAIYERYVAEDHDEGDTAEWFNIPVSEVQAAISFQEAWSSPQAA
jgi:hypothetical protein